jgi:LysR family hydrogen peroxide-inducible transcriptional activator
VRTPTLKQLKALVTVVETGHFGLAAQRLNLTQPTLSQQIKTLEEGLRAPLLERAPRLRLTPVGEEVVRRARRILLEADDLVDAVRGATAGFGGLVRLGVLPTVGPYLLPGVLAILHRRFPTLRLHVREDRPRPLAVGLDEGRFDMTLSVLPVAGPAEARALLVEDILVGLPADHPLAERSEIGEDDLQGEALITLGRGHPLTHQAERFAAAQHATILTEFEGSSLDAIRQMVATGLGVALFPSLYVRSEIARQRDVGVVPVRDGLTRTIGLAWRRSSPRAEAFRALADEIGDAARDRFADLVERAES